MRIYVIGPVSGHDDLNVPAFEHARKALRESGFVPLVPHDFVPDGADWQAAMRRSLETLVKADGVAYLEGWQKSHGARLEWKVARALGIEVAAVENWCSIGSRRAGLTIQQKKRKKCPHCMRVLPSALFDDATGKADGLQGYCRDCMADYKRTGNGDKA